MSRDSLTETVQCLNNHRTQLCWFIS
jgi:hypothetical protein